MAVRSEFGTAGLPCASRSTVIRTTSGSVRTEQRDPIAEVKSVPAKHPESAQDPCVLDPEHAAALKLVLALLSRASGEPASVRARFASPDCGLALTTATAAAGTLTWIRPVAGGRRRRWLSQIADQR